MTKAHLDRGQQARDEQRGQLVEVGNDRNRERAATSSIPRFRLGSGLHPRAGRWRLV